MLNRRACVNLLVCSTSVTATDAAIAKKQHHKNGHYLVGAKLKQNGRHQN
jgi:hypothetical protein